MFLLNFPQRKQLFLHLQCVNVVCVHTGIISVQPQVITKKQELSPHNSSSFRSEQEHHVLKIPA